MCKLNNCESRLLRAATIIAVAIPLAFGFVHAQQDPASQNSEAVRLPSFDVATVKPNVTGCCTSTRATADQMMMTNQTLKNLIVLAYGVQSYQVTGPDWMEKVRFDITAKFPVGTKYEDRWLMLRTLLEERFKLVAHGATKEMSGYSLEVGKTGFKLKPSDPGEPITTGGNQGAVWTFRARKIPMSALTYELAASLGEVVVDETGLTGAYSFQLRWATNETANETASPNASESEPAPSVFTALEEALGLQLRHGKVQAPVIVVDHLERTPTEN